MNAMQALATTKGPMHKDTLVFAEFDAIRATIKYQATLARTSLTVAVTDDHAENIRERFVADGFRVSVLKSYMGTFLMINRSKPNEEQYRCAQTIKYDKLYGHDRLPVRPELARKYRQLEQEGKSRAEIAQMCDTTVGRIHAILAAHPDGLFDPPIPKTVMVRPFSAEPGLETVLEEIRSENKRIVDEEVDKFLKDKARIVRANAVLAEQETIRAKAVFNDPNVGKSNVVPAMVCGDFVVSRETASRALDGLKKQKPCSCDKRKVLDYGCDCGGY